jgi:hypothetical protein
MKVKQIIKVEKEIEFELPEARFIHLNDCIYIGFFPGEPIRVIRLSTGLTENSFELDVREPLDSELNDLSEVGNNSFVEITEEEFTNKVNEELVKHNFIKEHVIQTAS